MVKIKDDDLKRFDVCSDFEAELKEFNGERPKPPWLPAAKSTTEQRVKFVPKNRSLARPTQSPYWADRPASPEQAVTRASRRPRRSANLG